MERNDNMRKTKIVCTLGPSTDKEDVLKQLMLEGMNVARCNFSHGSYEEHKKRMDMVKKLRKELGKPVAILLDTKGPEVRLKNFKDGKVTLEEGQSYAKEKGVEFMEVSALKTINVKETFITLAHNLLNKKIKPKKAVSGDKCCIIF